MILRHICENCGKDQNLTPEDASEQGWDYPPTFMGFGILSPRTCGECGIDTTLWWRLTTGAVTSDTLTEADLALIKRIVGEPASIIVREEP